MRLLVSGLILGIVLVSGYFLFSEEREITNYPPKNKTIVAFGDSLVFGYGATPGNDFVTKLGKSLGRKVVNLGVSGDTTADGVARMDEVREYTPGIVLLLLGGNDFLRRLDESVTRTNLETLITTFQSSGAVVVLVGVQGGIILDGKDEMYEALADTYGAFYVSNILEDIFGEPELMFDGIHPNDAGYAKIAERLTEFFLTHEL